MVVPSQTMASGAIKALVAPALCGAGDDGQEFMDVVACRFRQAEVLRDDRP